MSRTSLGARTSKITTEKVARVIPVLIRNELVIITIENISYNLKKKLNYNVVSINGASSRHFAHKFVSNRKKTN